MRLIKPVIHSFNRVSTRYCTAEVDKRARSVILGCTTPDSGVVLKLRLDCLDYTVHRRLFLCRITRLAVDMDIHGY